MPTAIQEHVETLTARIAEVTSNAETIYRTAREENRDPVESEQATLDRLGAKVDDLNAQLKLATRGYSVDAEVQSKLDMIRGAAAPVAYRNAGALLWDMLHAQSDGDAAERYRRGIVQPMASRAAEHLGLDKANTVAVAGGFNGLVVAPNVGPVLDPFPGDMPMFTALNPQTITSATFQRPRIVDPDFDTSLSDNPKEKEEGESKAWDIVMEPVTMRMVRGYINVSELLLEMVAESLNMVVVHMNKRLAGMLEGKAIANVGSTTASIPLAANATAAAVQSAIMTASGMVADATGALASWVAFGTQGFVRLGSLTNLAGDSIVQVGAGNATGLEGDVFGLRPVYTPGIADASLYVGNAASQETYERRFPIMQALEPALFGRQIGVAGGYAFYNPPTTESPDGGTTPAKREGIVKIAWAA